MVKQNEDKTIFCQFFKCLLNFSADALQSELNKVSISDLQRISPKIEGAFEKMIKFSLKIVSKRTIITQLKGPQINVKFLHEEKMHFFVKNILLFCYIL